MVHFVLLITIIICSTHLSQDYHTIYSIINTKWTMAYLAHFWTMVYLSHFWTMVYLPHFWTIAYLAHFWTMAYYHISVIILLFFNLYSTTFVWYVTVPSSIVCRTKHAGHVDIICHFYIKCSFVYLRPTSPLFLSIVPKQFFVQGDNNIRICR